VGSLVKTIDMPAVIDGNSIFIPSGEIVIADGCSGLRYFTISLAIGYVISYLNGYTGRKLITTLAVAALIGLFTNWLRIFLLVIIGHETNMQSSLMSDHEYFGWILFALAAAPALYFAPVVQRNPNPSTPVNLPVRHCMLPIGLLALGPALNAILDTTPTAQPLSAILGSSYAPILEKRMPIPINAPPSTRIENAMDGNKVYIQINQYQRINQEQKLVPYLKRLYNSDQWSIVGEKLSNVDSSRIKIQIFRNKHNGIIVAQAQWFAIAGTTANSYSQAKLLQVPAILGNQNVFSIYSLQSTCSDTNCAPEIQHILARSSALINPL
jgi:exosortase/archaeosortase family protein